jgi:hypothetical protein
VRIVVNAILPSFLRKRGWKIALWNAGTATFMLESGAARDVDIRLRAGRRYSTADVAKAKHPSIEIIARADGIVVGGFSYPLRDKTKRPVKQKRKSRRTAKSRTAASAKSRAAAKNDVSGVRAADPAELAAPGESCIRLRRYPFRGRGRLTASSFA